MSDTQHVETTSPTHQDQREIRLDSPSRRAAAVEAAYILEAVRK